MAANGTLIIQLPHGLNSQMMKWVTLGKNFKQNVAEIDGC